MEKRRVVVTGIGVVAPNGTGIDKFWDSLVHGRSAIRRITQFDASTFPCQVAAEVPDFDPSDYMDFKTEKRLARFAQFALAASKMAIEDSLLDLRSVDPYRVGTVIGTGLAGNSYSENQHLIFVEKGLKRVSPFAAVMSCGQSAPGIISIELGIKGPNTTLSSGCNSGLDAIHLAYNSIQMGDADVILAGAGEAPVSPYIVALFWAGKILTAKNEDPTKALTPFDIRGDGTVLGEGGAVVVLEALDSALKRKAKIYGQVLSCASGNESYDLFKLDPSGETASILMKRAVRNADLEPQQINYINAHGSGLLAYDVNETRAIKKAFGGFAGRIPVSSIKPITGQSLSVTGILQVITSLLVINNNIIPPTMNHARPPEDCDLDYVPSHFRQSRVDTVLINSHGFGGGNTVVILGKAI
jgi:3-oxoacyl-[acyl-carrier-protein] synthase II